MVDRDARDLMIAGIHAYMDERTSAFEFDEALRKIDTPDKTVREVGLALWRHYDDVKDHLIVGAIVRRRSANWPNYPSHHFRLLPV